MLTRLNNNTLLNFDWINRNNMLISIAKQYLAELEPHQIDWEKGIPNGTCGGTYAGLKRALESIVDVTPSINEALQSNDESDLLINAFSCDSMYIQLRNHENSLNNHFGEQTEIFMYESVADFRIKIDAWMGTLKCQCSYPDSLAAQTKC